MEYMVFNKAVKASRETAYEERHFFMEKKKLLFIQIQQHEYTCHLNIFVLEIIFFIENNMIIDKWRFFYFSYLKLYVGSFYYWNYMLLYFSVDLNAIRFYSFYSSIIIQIFNL